MGQALFIFGGDAQGDHVWGEVEILPWLKSGSATSSLLCEWFTRSMHADTDNLGSPDQA